MVAAMGWLSACAANSDRASTDVLPRFDGPMADFCQQAQHLLTGSTVPATNVVHADYDACVLSKAQINPLTTQQLVHYLDEGGRQARMISCKLKTVDNIIAEFGADAAVSQRRCRDIHERLVAELAAAEPEAAPVIVDDDQVIDIHVDDPGPLGPEWLKPHLLAYRDKGGRLHLRGKEFRVDMGEPRYANAPPQFRGIHYCHVIAPDYLRRLALGEAQLPTDTPSD